MSENPKVVELLEQLLENQKAMFAHQQAVAEEAKAWREKAYLEQQNALKATESSTALAKVSVRIQQGAVIFVLMLFVLIVALIFWPYSP